MYDFAQANRLTFYLTPTNIDTAVARGRLVELDGGAAYELTKGVGFSYATREAKQFVTQFAPQYQYACGTPLTVTSAARPTSRQPRNANPHSVHPTGIAVDIRRPNAGPCLNWVRSALSDLEERGLIEATEERHPVHLHVAVLVAPGAPVRLPSLTNGIAAAPRVMTPPSAPVAVAAAARVVAPRQPVAKPARVTAASNGATDAELDITGKSYRVREGDTLWGVARRAGVSVKALARANKRSTRSVLHPGTTLSIPGA
jgi:hypothetical protein